VVEQLFRKQQAIGSNPITGSLLFRAYNFFPAIKLMKRCMSLLPLNIKKDSKSG
jgi:hypothetical protein